MGIVVPAKQSDVPDSPCENPLTGKNLVNTIQKEFERDGRDQYGNGGMNSTYPRSRYLDNVTGVSHSTDPAGQFYNPSGYAMNPVMFVDPSGSLRGG